MKKGNSSKALYHFTKKQKNKYSISTKDLNDSLDYGEISPLSKPNKNDKKLHQRTQSCPSIDNQPKISQSLLQNGDTSRNSNKVKTRRSQGEGKKLGHRNCHSQASIQSLSLNPCNISIQNLSAILYRKNSKETSLKKLGIGVSGKEKKFMMNSQLYNKAKLQQQMKKYELNQQLRKVEKSTQGITLKQQVLENLLSKFEFQSAVSNRELISS